MPTYSLNLISTPNSAIRHWYMLLELRQVTGTFLDLGDIGAVFGSLSLSRLPPSLSPALREPVEQR